MNQKKSWYIDKIIIDSKEKVRGHRAYNHYIEFYDVDVAPLSYGDYLFHMSDGKKTIFEFKNCKDFISSMENKSLFQELSNQTMNYEYSYLIICGDFEKTFDDLYWNVPHYRYKYKTPRVLRNRLRSQIKGALNRIYAMYIPIIFVDTEEDAFNQMHSITSKIADAKKYGGVVRPSVKELELNPVTFFLSGINGIGDKKSEKITKHLELDCLDDLCNTKLSDLLSVRGISESSVEELWSKIHNEDLVLKK